MRLTRALLLMIKQQAEADQGLWDGMPGKSRQGKINNLRKALLKNGAHRGMSPAYFENAIKEYGESAASEILEAFDEWCVVPCFTENEKNNIAPIYSRAERIALDEDYQNYQLFKRLRRIERRGV